MDSYGIGCRSSKHDPGKDEADLVITNTFSIRYPTANLPHEWSYKEEDQEHKGHTRE